MPAPTGPPPGDARTTGSRHYGTHPRGSGSTGDTAVVPARVPGGVPGGVPHRAGAGPTATGERRYPADARRTEGSDGVMLGNRPATHADVVRIDETLTRLTAAHAGLVLDRADQDDEPLEPPPTRRRSRPFLRLVFGLAALAVFAAAALGTYTRGGLERSLRDAGALDPDAGAVVDAEVQRGDQNVLVVATDVGGGDARADTLAVVHVPDGGGPPSVLTIPAGLEINRPPCDRWNAVTAEYTDEVVPAEARTQLLSAMDVGGPRCTVRVVQQLTGLLVTGYVGTDLTAVGALAEAAGGVGVCVAQPVVDAELGPVVPDAGTAVLAGVAAADFARAGAVEGDPPGDAGRIARQQQLLAGVLDRALGGTALLDVPGTSALGTALGTALMTDGLEPEQVLATARTVGGEGVRFAAAPVAAEPNAAGRAVLLDTDAAALFEAMREDAPLPEAPAAGTAPADVTIELINGSDRTGLAAEVGDTLKALGFGIGAVSNAAQPTPATIIRFSPDRAAAAALLATTVPSAEQVPDPGSSGVLQLVLGRSFDDVVQPPAATAPAQSATTVDAGTAPAGCR